ncbi:hemerythrin domain-containing protein [Streptomyces sp. NPDC049687]|uniref:hemerythrin domain-containing protein n=1 Tax=Streptomyces sp. NPDC049687 TaxID=3365596 RepID=UPI00379CF24B
MVVIHRIFRRESGLLARLVRAVSPGDTARAELLAENIEEYLTGLHHHHSLEEELIWPLLSERASGHQEVVELMKNQHQAIDITLAAISTTLPFWRERAHKDAGELLAGALDEHREILLVHLDHEEKLVLPLIEDHLTVAEWDRVGKHGLETVPKDKLMLALGAILEEANPQERAYFLARVPAVGRLALRLVGRRQYARRRRLVRDDLYTVQAGTRTVFADAPSLQVGAGVAPFRAYGSPHS